MMDSIRRKDRPLWCSGTKVRLAQPIPGIVRNRLKIAASILNAHAFLLGHSGRVREL